MLHLVTRLCALACGLVGGFLFAFSTCVMRALGQMPAPRGNHVRTFAAALAFMIAAGMRR